MLRPLLFIGLGGAGGKTLRAAKQQLHETLIAKGNIDGIPAAWQFLHLDSIVDGIGFPAPMLSAQEICKLAPAGITFIDIVKKVESLGTKEELQRMLSGWGISLPVVPINQPPTTVRAAGRMVLVANLANAFHSIQGSINRMLSAEALEQLKRVSGNLDIDFTPRVFIISSLGGTSGSGMFLDVAELVRIASPFPWADEVTSFLYTPEVFEEVMRHQSHIPMNTFGAMNELISKSWVHNSEVTEMLYARNGLAASRSNKPIRPGAAKSIFIGAANKSGVNLLNGPDSFSMDNVFLGVGQLLSAIAVDDFAMDLLVQQHSSIDNSGLAPKRIDKQNTEFSGIGFAKLSLGTEHIVDYVADALTKAQVKILLWPEFVQIEKREEHTSDLLIHDEVDKRWPEFLAASGLSQLDDQNQITEAIYPVDWEIAKGNTITKVIDAAVRDRRGRSVPLETFEILLWNEWASSNREVNRIVDPMIEERARAWVLSIQQNFISHVAHEISLSGYSVSIGLVQRLYDQLKSEVLEELFIQEVQYARAVTEPGALISRIRLIADGITGVSAQNSGFLNGVAQLLSKAFSFQVQSHVIKMSHNLLEDFLDAFLEPLIVSLRDAYSELKMELRHPTLWSGNHNPFPRFPEWRSGEVSKAYHPRTFECALIEPSEYEEYYERYAAFDTGSRDPFYQSVTNALLGLSLSGPRDNLDTQCLAQLTTPWVTRVRDAQSHNGQVAGKMKSQFHTGILDLVERNRTWLQRRESSFGKFTAMPIVEFLDDRGIDKKSKDQRENRFISEFQSMISIAQPLIKLNDNAMRFIEVMGVNEPADSIIYSGTRLPFDMNSVLGTKCTAILQNFGADVFAGSFPQKWFNPGGRDTTLFVASTNNAAMPVWAFASLTDPILEQLAISRHGNGGRQQLWEGRRARPLVEAIPLETEIRRSIITGWLIARLFGIHKDQIPEVSDALPEFLLRAGIKLAEFGKTGESQAIETYRSLKHIGREVTTSLMGRDVWDERKMDGVNLVTPFSQSAIVSGWIKDGIKPDQELSLNKRLRECADNPEDRRQALLLTIKSQSEPAWHRFDGMSWSVTPQIFELKDDMNQAWKDITTYVENLSL